MNESCDVCRHLGQKSIGHTGRVWLGLKWKDPPRFVAPYHLEVSAELCPDHWYAVFDELETILHSGKTRILPELEKEQNNE